MFENYDLDDIETEIVDAFISAFVDRDPIAMRELIYQLTDFMEGLDEEEGPLA
jgi:hypothetical protein